jgi:DNA-binding IclR family transcriptional regulator
MSQEHRVPAIDRAVAILDALGRYRDGLSLVGIARECRVTRSTGYRILNSLVAAGLVRRTRQSGHYALGPRLLGLATAARASLYALDLVGIAHPHLQRLSAVTGEASKLSVLDGGQALCIDAVAGTNEYALSPLVAQSFPLHAGAASKILLAGMPAAARAAIVGGPLARYNERTVVDGAALNAELGRIAADGWAEDRGEHSQSVCALAAPVKDAAGAVIATVSMVYLAERHQAMQRRHLLDLQQCCVAIGADLARDEATGRQATVGEPSRERRQQL